jgi:hypothetical protein
MTIKGGISLSLSSFTKHAQTQLEHKTKIHQKFKPHLLIGLLSARKIHQVWKKLC